MAGRVAVVCAANQFLRWADRREVHAGKLPHRSVHVLLFDGAGRLVVQRRHPAKLTWPDAWDVSASGHVEEEDYLAGPDDALPAVYARVAARELTEELGVAAPLDLVAWLPPEPGVHYEHIGLYRGVHGGPYRLQADEVAEVRAVDAAGLAALAAHATVTASLSWLVRRGLVF